MQRRSLLGPILLIVAGVVLLAVNLRPELSLSHLFANYWPWILILWGGFRLLEFLALRLLGRPTPPPLGAGSVLLAVLLCLLGSAAHALERSEARFLSWPIEISELLDKRFEFPISESRSAPPHGRLVLRSVSGRVKIVGSGGELLRVNGTKRIAALSRNAARRLDARTPLEVSDAGGEIVIQAAPIAGHEADRVDYDLEITVPRGLPLSVEQSRASLEVEGIAGAVSIQGVKFMKVHEIDGPVRVAADHARRLTGRGLAGGLRLQGDCQSVDLEQVAGPVEMEGAIFGSVRLARVEQPSRIASEHLSVEFVRLPGALEMKSGSVSLSGVVGPLKLKARGSRSIRLEKFSGAVEIEAQRSDLVLLAVDSQPGAIQARVERGDIELALDPAASFSLEAVTQRGQATHDLGATIETVKQGSAVTLRGERGTGPSIRLRTERGNISISEKRAPERPEVRL